MAITDLQSQAELTLTRCYAHFPRALPVCRALLQPQSIELNQSDRK